MCIRDRAYQGEGGLKGAIDSSGARKVIIALPDQGLVMDADNPEDYRRLEQYSESTAQLPPLSCRAKVSLCRTESFFDEQLAKILEPVSYTHLDVYKRQPQRCG